MARVLLKVPSNLFILSSVSHAFLLACVSCFLFTLTLLIVHLFAPIYLPIDFLYGYVIVDWM